MFLQRVHRLIDQRGTVRKESANAPLPGKNPASASPCNPANPSDKMGESATTTGKFDNVLEGERAETLVRVIQSIGSQ